MNMWVVITLWVVIVLSILGIAEFIKEEAWGSVLVGALHTVFMIYLATHWLHR